MNEKQYLELKQAVLAQCKARVAERIATIEKVLADLEEARDNETKSSVGDKYETGRAMMQLEVEKNKGQLLQALHAKKVLATLNATKPFEQAEPGSLIVTDTHKYYLSIGMGKIILDQELVYAISPEAPIGKILRHRQAGEEAQFNGRPIKILVIV